MKREGLNGFRFEGLGLSSKTDTDVGRSWVFFRLNREIFMKSIMHCIE
jgi:hypothetical protein